MRPPCEQISLAQADEIDSSTKIINANVPRVKHGQVQKNNFGFWIKLDKDLRGIASSVGSGLVADYEMIASYPNQGPPHREGG